MAIHMTNVRIRRPARGWLITIGICLLPVLLWLRLYPPGDLFSGYFTTLTNLGKIAGLLAVTAYALNFIYATRLRLLEDWFGGLNKLYVAHHLLGGLALIMMLLHPLLLSAALAKDALPEAARLLLPDGLLPLGALFDSAADQHNMVRREWAILMGGLAFLGTIVLLVITFYAKVSFEFWLKSHRLLGVAFLLAGLHVALNISDPQRSLPLKLFLLAIIALGLAAFVYRTLLGNILIRRYRYRVKAVIPVGKITNVLLEPAAGRPLQHQPGQFLFIRFLDGDKLRHQWHPFSISSAPGEPALRISVKALGDFTASLPGLRPGSPAEIEGAYGHFSYLRDAGRSQIWIAGGIGITPFLAMAGSLLGRRGYSIDLYHSVASASELLGSAYLGKLTHAPGNRFKYMPWISARQGLLSAQIIAGHSGVADKDIFICGPPPMMKSLRRQFGALNVPKNRIRTEEFRID